MELFDNLLKIEKEATDIVELESVFSSIEESVELDSVMEL